MSAANAVLWLGSVHVGVGAGSHEGSGCWAKLMSSAWPPLPTSAGVVPALAALAPGVTSPAMFPEAISCLTSLGVIGHGLPSTLVQSLAGLSFPSAIAL